MNSDSRIARKFRAYASTLDGFRDLDVLLADVPEGRRADFLFKGGQVIAEMKDINTEAQNAWAAYTQEGQRLARKYNFDPRPGEVALDRLSREDRRCFQQLTSKYARRFERFLSEANQQVESTKNILDLESAGGLLVLINDRAGKSLFHDLPAFLIRQFENGAPKGRFSHINGVFFAQAYVGYTIDGYDAGAGYMQVTRYVNQNVDEFGRYMIDEWKRWHGGVGRPIEGFLHDIPLPD